MHPAADSILSHLRRFAADESGAQLVEFAMVLPMMLLVFAIIVEGGRMMWSYQTVVAGVRDATRFLARVTPREVCDPGGTFNGYTDVLTTIIRTKNDGTSVLPSGVSLTSVAPSLNCVAGDYRSDFAPIVTVQANLRITFPFSGIFTLVGGSRPTLNTSVIDESRVYGS